MLRAKDRKHSDVPLLLRVGRGLRNERSTFVMAAIVFVLGFFLIYPVIFIFVQSFNMAGTIFYGEPEWGLDNWRLAWKQPILLRALGNSIYIWLLTLTVSFPIAVAIAWTLARTNIRFGHTLEFLFWVAYMMPGIATTIGWIMLLDPRVGLFNTWLERLPFVDQGPFNIYSVSGILWAHIVANGIAGKVMLLTPAFRNMDAALEEASRVSGGSNIYTIFRVTLPLMISPMMLVIVLQMMRIFQSFETEQLLGVRFDFFVYSTMIFRLIRADIPDYGQATVLASVTLVVIALIIPLQRWIVQRRRYTTIGSGFKPGLIKLGKWHPLVFGLLIAVVGLLTVVPFLVLVLGSFMTRFGFFQLIHVYTLNHWTAILTDPLYLTALKTSMILGLTGAIFSPLLFSVLAYILVRTRWRGRIILDGIIWVSAAVPGMLAGLGLLMIFLGTPGLRILFGSMWALVIVIILQGNTTGTNITKGVLIQIGQEMEEAARVAGAGWLRTFVLIWIPLLMPTLVMLAMINFTLAVGATSSVILLASRETQTLSIFALQLMGEGGSQWEQSGIVSITLIVMTVGTALVMRHFGLRLGVRHNMRADAGRGEDAGSRPRPTGRLARFIGPRS